MAEIIREKIVPVNPEYNLPSNSRDGRGLDREQALTGDDLLNDSGGRPYDPPGRGDRGDNSDDESSEPHLEDNASQDGVNGMEDKPSTDVSDSFGEYGTIFQDIINQLSSIFDESRDLPNNVNNPYRTDNPFKNWLNAISSIADNIGDGPEQTNLTNALNQIMAFYMQQLSAATQNQFNIEQWQVQNEYNSPVQQLKRLTSAGLNPLHFFDSGSTGSSTSVTASSGSAPSPAGAALGQTKSQRVMQGINAALGLGSTVASTALAGKQVAMQAAKLPGEIAQQAQNIVESESRVGSNQAQMAKYEQETANLAQQFGFAPELVSSQLKSTYANIRMQDATTSKTYSEQDRIDVEKERFVQAMKIEGERWMDEHQVNEETIKRIQQGLVNDKAQFNVIKNQAENIKSATDLNKFRNDFQKKYGLHAESDLSYFLAVKLANGEFTQQQFKSLISGLQLLRAQNTEIGVNQLMGTIGVETFNLLFELFGFQKNPIKEFEDLANPYEQRSIELLKGLKQNGGVPTPNDLNQ